ncbi:iron-containing alcohol dehydrogenase [Desulfothermus okinawensis JCM 13304]
MIPSYYEFYCPVKIISGNKALDNLPYELSQMGVSRPLVITDKGIVLAGIIDLVKEVFKEYNMDAPPIYDEVPPDSSNRIVNEAAAIFRKNKCDGIIAIGGGSAIDTAKGVNIVVSEDTDDLMQFVGAERIKKPLKPFVVIPTTSGTGSEVTLVAVIYNEDNGVKMAFTSYFLLPQIAILDPRMTLSLPPHITAATGMDALTHAVEAFYCIQKNPLSDGYAISAIRLIRENLIEAVKNGKNKDARLAMANAATMAGIAFSNSMVGMVHSLGHATGSVAHVPHGVAMSIFLPFGMEFNLEKNEKELAELLLYLGGEEEYVSTPKEKRAIKSIEIVRELKDKLYQLCNLPRTLKEAGVSEDKLPEIAKLAIDDPSIIFNPKEMSFDEAMKILKKAYN